MQQEPLSEQPVPEWAPEAAGQGHRHWPWTPEWARGRQDDGSCPVHSELDFSVVAPSEQLSCPDPS